MDPIRVKNGKQVRGRVRLEALTNLDMKFGLYPLVKVDIIESPLKVLEVLTRSYYVFKNHLNVCNLLENA